MQSMHPGDNHTGPRPVLLTISGTIPSGIRAQIEQGERPVADYIAMSEAFPADLMDYPKARQIAGWFGRVLETVLGPELVLAWACFLVRKRYRIIFTDGEQIGIPLALLFKLFGGADRPKHFMIVHILSVPKKESFFDWFHIQTHIDRFFVYSSYQKQFIEQRWNVPPERVIFTPFMVDHHFFSQECAQPGDRLHLLADGKPLICSVGLEFRDYPSLIEAVKDLDIKVVIAAGSPWSKREDSTHGQTVPAHILIRRFSQYDLRDVYAASRMMVMPLYPVEFQAGVTALLEAMAMGKPVICSRTPGQTDVIVDGQNGMYVEPQNPQALRQAILDLLDHPEKARGLGEAGRQDVTAQLSLEKYTQRLKEYIDTVIDESHPTGN